MDVPGVGPIPAGEAVSVVTEHQPTVILENYPGLVDVHEEEAAAPAIEPPVEGEPSVEN